MAGHRGVRGRRRPRPSGTSASWSPRWRPGFAGHPGSAPAAAQPLPAGSAPRSRAALAAPDVVWQAAHGWPQPGRVPRPAGPGRANRITYWPAQVLYHRPGADPDLGARAWSGRCAARRPGRSGRSAGLRDRDRRCSSCSAASRTTRAGPTRSCSRPGACRGRALAGRPARRGPPARPAARSAGGGHAGRPRPSGCRSRCRCCPPARCTRCRCRRSTTTWARRSAGPRQSRWSRASTTRCPPPQRAADHDPHRQLRRGRARIARYGPGRACPPPTAGPTTSGSGARRPPRDTAAVAVNVDPALLRREFASSGSRHLQQRARRRRRRAGCAGLPGHRPEVLLGQAWPAFRDYS